MMQIVRRKKPALDHQLILRFFRVLFGVNEPTSGWVDLAAAVAHLFIFQLSGLDRNLIYLIIFIMDLSQELKSLDELRECSLRFFFVIFNILYLRS
jgi:hypothetical protein